MSENEDIVEGVVEIYGARVHNLKNIDVVIPREQLIVITGLSGSGKSSLAVAGLVAGLRPEKAWRFAAFRPGSNERVCFSNPPSIEEALNDTQGCRFRVRVVGERLAVGFSCILPLAGASECQRTSSEDGLP